MGYIKFGYGPSGSTAQPDAIYPEQQEHGFFQQLTDWTGQLSGLLWGNPGTLLVLLGTGLYLTVRMGLIQLCGFRHAASLIS